ncbi:MAG: LacI family DNA-binding transcriptional regulator [Rhodobacterales bacterium]|nr:LacI family DNA-binding transcriptional regulator [Rhodobacterales bacterium]
MARVNVTAADVAERVGVSKWTVIRAFDPNGRITDETRRKVLAAADELNYQPNLLARSLRTNQTQQVAILIDDFSNPFMLPALGCLAGKLQDAGLLSVVLNINDHLSHLRAIASARQRRLDAIISFGVSFDPKSVVTELDMTQGSPIYVLARESTSSSLPSLYTEGRSAVTAMSEHLHARGYRRPVFFGGPKSAATALGRRRYYQEFWVAKGLPKLREIASPLYELGAATKVFRTYLEGEFRQHPADVVLCENDILAIAALDVARFERGLRVPQDLAVVGFDNIPLSGTRAYDVTTISQPYAKMIDAVIEMILGNSATESRAFPGELVLRSSA